MRRKRWGRAVSAVMSAVLAATCIPDAGMVAQAATDAVYAEFGTPTIDGIVDEVWSSATAYTLDQPTLLDGIQATAKVLWDDKALYILTEVLDNTPDKSSFNAYEQDSVEIFLDELYNGGTSYSSDDLHYRVNYENTKTSDAGEMKRWITAAQTFERPVEGAEEGTVQQGYYIEACIRFADTTVPANGLEMGFDAQVNAAEGGSRKGTINIFDTTGTAYQNPSKMGKLVLQGREDGEQSGAYPFDLQNYVAEISAMDLSLYVPETAEKVTAALAAANSLLSGGGYTQAQLDEAYAAIETAVAALAVAAEETMAYGTVIVDGIKEDAWNCAEALTVANALDATEATDGTADVRLLWDEVFLYVLADVTDEDVYTDHGSDENEDSITLTLAQNTAMGNQVKEYVLTAGGDALNIQWESSFSWSTWGAVATKVYKEATDIYMDSALTDTGYQLEACIPWSSLGMTPAAGSNFAFEAIVNNCSTASGTRDFRRAIALTEYPVNTDTCKADFWGTVYTGTYTADLFAQDLISFALDKADTITTIATDIGRYALVNYANGFYDAYVAPYPEKSAYDEAKIEAAKSYALSAAATAEGINQQKAQLEAMLAQLEADNCSGKLMSKKGTPIVDGDGDDAVWANAYSYYTGRDNSGQYAEIKSLWDEEAAYFLVKVFDTSYDVSGSSAHEKDSVEFFFIPMEDAKQNSFGKNGGQWRINRANQTTVTFGANEPFYAKLSEVSDGYIVEARFEFADEMNITKDSILGMDIGVNLCADGSRSGSVAWASGDCYSNPNTAGEIIFLDRSAGESVVDSSYNPYALLKLLDKALVMDASDYDAEDFAQHYDAATLQQYYDDAVAGNLTSQQITTYYNAVINMMSKITYDGEHKSVLGFKANADYPDAFTMEDGTKVDTEADWELRHEEIQDLYEFYMYGKLPDAEETGLVKEFAASEDGSEYTVTVSREGIEPASFTFKVNFPEGEAPEGGWPYIINYGGNISEAQAAGYAVVEYSNYGTVASNDSYYNGVFYTMYPECRGEEYVTGVGPLAARAWGAGLIIDCIENETGRLGELDPAKSVVSGFSFLGKTTLVTGVLEDRIAVTNPQHSGIGGAAPFRYSSQGKYYSNEEYDMLNNYLITKTEPIGQVQGQGMAWVKTIFADFLGGDNTPFDTYMLLSLVAPRGLFVSSGYYDNGTDPEGMYASYLGAQKVYEFLGEEDNIAFGNFETSLSAVHSVGDGEVAALLQFCDHYFYGEELPEGFYDTVYDESPDRAEYDVIRIPLTASKIEALENKLTQGAANAQESAAVIQEILQQMYEDGTLEQMETSKKTHLEEMLSQALLTISNESSEWSGIVSMTGGLLHKDFQSGDSFTLKASVTEEANRPVISGNYITQSAFYLDLQLLLNEAETSVSSPATITVGLPASIDKTKPIKVLHYAEGSTNPEELNAKIVNTDYVQFTTDSFSTFVIVNGVVPPAPANPPQSTETTEESAATESSEATTPEKEQATKSESDKETVEAETVEEELPASSTEAKEESKSDTAGKQETTKEDTAKQESVESTEATEESQQSATDTTVLVSEPEQSGNLPMVVIIIVAAVLIVCAGGAFYMVKRRK